MCKCPGKGPSVPCIFQILYSSDEVHKSVEMNSFKFVKVKSKSQPQQHSAAMPNVGDVSDRYVFYSVTGVITFPHSGAIYKCQWPKPGG